jgi:hypothetical protein
VDELKVGAEVEISYRLSGRKWQKDPQSEVKFFLSAEALRFKILSGSASPDESTANDAFNEAREDDNEIPF